MKPKSRSAPDKTLPSKPKETLTVPLDAPAAAAGSAQDPAQPGPRESKWITPMQYCIYFHIQPAISSCLRLRRSMARLSHGLVEAWRPMARFGLVGEVAQQHRLLIPGPFCRDEKSKNPFHGLVAQNRRLVHRTTTCDKRCWQHHARPVRRCRRRFHHRR